MRIKICGITNINDAIMVLENGAHSLGFIFYEKSKRYITPEKAREISEKMPPFISKTGVFVNEDIKKVIKIAETVKLDVVQLHGNEDSEYIKTVEEKFKVLKAIRVKEEKDLDIINKLKLKWVLLDAFSANEYGGTGKTFNWELLKKVPSNVKVILAGGITIGNIDEILEKYQPYGIDISSGVEDSPGIKNREKVADIMKKVGR